MKLSNFKINKTIMKYGTVWEEFGTVDITTGFLLWKKTVTRKIAKMALWYFADTGQYLPNHIKALERAYKATLEVNND